MRIARKSKLAGVTAGIVLICTFAHPPGAHGQTRLQGYVTDPVEEAIRTTPYAFAEGAKWGGVIITNGAVYLTARSGLEQFLRTGKPPAYDGSESNRPVERAVAAFLKTLDGRIGTCRGKIALIFATPQLDRRYWFVLAERVSLLTAMWLEPPTDPEVDGEALHFAFGIEPVEAMYRTGDADTGYQYAPVDPALAKRLPVTQTVHVFIRKRKASIEKVLPTPGVLSTRSELSLDEVKCRYFPRLSERASMENDLKLLGREERIPYLKALVQQGKPDAAFLLGWILIGDKGQRTEGVRLLKAAADLEVGDASMELADINLLGTALPQNIPEGVRYINLAMNDLNWVKRAETKMELLDKLGVWPPVDSSIVSAMKLDINRSPTANLVAALDEFSGKGAAMDPANAMERLLKSARLGSLKGNILLGRSCLFGRGIPQSLKSARQAYAQASVLLDAPEAEALPHDERSRYRQEATVFKEVFAEAKVTAEVPPEQFLELFIDKLPFQIDFPFAPPKKP